MKVREEVKWFAEQMEEVLRKNDYKGGWQDCTRFDLLCRLYDEATELFGAAVRETSNETIIKEAVDVANFAMMIADIARRQP
jgi:NTP pyrophosphatase (non-canonical NTP hydrolase)